MSEKYHLTVIQNTNLTDPTGAEVVIEAEMRKMIDDPNRISIVSALEMPYAEALLMLIEGALYLNSDKEYKVFHFEWKQIKWVVANYPKEDMDDIESMANDSNFLLINDILPVRILGLIDGEYSPIPLPCKFPIQGPNVFSFTYTHEGFKKYKPKVEILEEFMDFIGIGHDIDNTTQQQTL